MMCVKNKLSTLGDGIGTNCTFTHIQCKIDAWKTTYVFEW